MIRKFKVFVLVFSNLHWRKLLQINFLHSMTVFKDLKLLALFNVPFRVNWPECIFRCWKKESFAIIVEINIRCGRDVTSFHKLWFCRSSRKATFSTSTFRQKLSCTVCVTCSVLQIGFKQRKNDFIFIVLDSCLN